MTEEPRETTLGEYLRSLRRGWMIIAVVALVCAAAALGASLIQRPTYQAEASETVQDPEATLALAGVGVPTNQTPLQIASSHASQVTRTEVAQRVKSSLHSPLSTNALTHAVSVSVDPNSALVQITATARTAADAAALANAFADVDAALSATQARSQYALQARQLQRKLLAGAASKDPASRVIYLTQLARVQTLASVAAPVQVNTRARIPTSPSSPQPVRNTVAALVFGLLLGALLAYGRDAFGRRLRRPADVEKLFDHPVIGGIRSQAFGTTCAHAGGSSNGIGPPAHADQEAFQVLRQNVRFMAQDTLPVVLVTSAMPEEGKSTVAACLAAATAAAGRRTLLVECDLRRPVLAKRLGLEKGPGLIDYLTGTAEPREIVRAVPLLHAGVNGGPRRDSLAPAEPQSLVCITAGTPTAFPTELLASERFRTFLRQIEDAYDTVILDTPPVLTVADTVELIPDASGVVLCVRLRQTTRDQARALQAALERLPSRPMGVVLTDMRSDEEGYYGYYGYYGYQAAPAVRA